MHPLHLAAMDFKPNHIVWIAQWYPREGEPYAGDFIQRHAQAVSAFVPVTVYCCFGYAGEEKTEVTTTGNLTEVVTYFKTADTGIAKLDKVIYWNRWYRIQKNLLIKHEVERGRPALIHCHIILNAGWLGLWAKRKWGTPFIVTEHWAGYMEGFTNGYTAYNSWSKRKCKSIIHQAAVVTGVSQALIHQLKNIGPRGNFLRWANVVNEKIFYYKPNIIKKTRPVFIHISTLTWQKNPSGIINAVHAVKALYPTVLLKIAGPVHDHFKTMILDLELQPNITWLGEMPQAALAEQVRNSLALILFSQFESFGCVVIEANAAGVPVIVSDIDPLKELVQDGFNGLIATEGNIDSLTAAMKSVIEQKIPFNNAVISQQTLARFAYPVVGKQMVDMYLKILG